MSTTRSILWLGVVGLVVAMAAGRARAGEAAGEGGASAEGSSQETDYLAYEEAGVPESAGAATLIGRVVGALVVVVGLIFLTGVLVRRFARGGRVATTRRKLSELVEVTPLGGKRYLYLIRVADRLLVVGAGGDRLSLLSEVRDPAVLEQAADRPRRKDFLDVLRRATVGDGEETPAEKQGAAG
jgi:flagellar biogenesis protein FliO